MKTFQLTLVLFFAFVQAGSGWGPIGHRVVGQIAENHLSKKARKNIQEVLGNESLAMVSNWMDFVKSDPGYDFMYTWHQVTIPDGKTYEETGIPQSGDIIQMIEKFIQELETKQFTLKDEASTLKCLIHLVGDIHQPLHVGNGLDRGGNDVRVTYFGKKTNLHAVWDSGIINKQQMSFTEYVRYIDYPATAQITDWQSGSVLDWAAESMSYRERVYDFPEDNKISWKYNYKNLELVNHRLLQAGIRLAGILNKVYG